SSPSCSLLPPPPSSTLFPYTTLFRSPVFAQTPAGATAAGAVISSVAITQAPERSAVRVEGEGRLDVHAGRMQNPERLVLDFAGRSEEHTSELQSRGHLVCRLLLEKKN